MQILEISMVQVENWFGKHPQSIARIIRLDLKSSVSYFSKNKAILFNDMCDYDISAYS